MLGPLVVHRDAEVTIASPQQRCLAALLALHANKVVSQAEIVDVLWGHTPPPTYRELLYAIVSRLRRYLDDRSIETRNTGYLLDIDPERVDVWRFTEQAARARAGGENLCVFTKALGQWRGPVLADLPDALRQHPSAIALQQYRIVTGLSFADRAFAEGVYDVVPWLVELADSEPLHEGLHARLIVALAGTGRRADAIVAYQRIRDRLDRDLGLRPGNELMLALKSLHHPNGGMALLACVEQHGPLTSGRVQ